MAAMQISLRPAQILFRNAVIGASAIHLLWAFLITYDPTVQGTATALAGLKTLFPNPDVEVIMLAGGAILASLGLFTRFPWNATLLLPQAALLILSDIGVWHAVAVGQFARGFAAPRTQILADQSLIVFISLSYFTAVILSGLMEVCGKQRVRVL